MEINLEEKSKNKLIDGLNKHGFVLEDRFWRIVDGLNIVNQEGKIRNLPFESKNDSGEIDAVISIIGSNRHPPKKLIVECKKTHNSWLFPIREDEVSQIVIRKKRQTGFHYDVKTSNGICVANSNTSVPMSEKFKIQDRPPNQLR